MKTPAYIAAAFGLLFLIFGFIKQANAYGMTDFISYSIAFTLLGIFAKLSDR